MPMACPRCLNQPLKQSLGPRGVLIDSCPKCTGIWLDKGEIYYYVRSPQAAYAAIAEAYRRPSPSRFLCLRCDVQMLETKFSETGPLIDACRKCGGTWFDKGEVDTLNALLDRQIAVPAPSAAPPAAASPAAAASASVAKAAAALGPLPNLAARSAAVLGSLYGLAAVCGLLIGLRYRLGISAVLLGSAAALALNFLLSPWIMDLSLRWLHAFSWVEPASLPPPLRAFMEKVCAERGFPFPSVGIIEDQNPNAFTYGHRPGNARLVLTRGILDRLDEAEMRAVLAHELGHIVHWDMLVMTLAALVPTLLYALYRACRRAGASSKKGGGPVYAIGLLALALYYVTEYVVLFLSRTRELHADRFAGEVTGQPAALASALVKVAYGLAGAGPAAAGAPGAEMARALGLFDPVGAQALVASTLTRKGPSKDAILGAMQWDLWNPWAKYYELSSTHPLPAHRIELLGLQSQAYGQEPFVRFDLKRPESYWDEFAVDLLYLWAPWLGAALLYGGSLMRSGLSTAGVYHAAVGGALGALMRLWFCYEAGQYAELTVGALLKRVKVSRVRGVPATLKGRVIGRGVAGYLVSEDVVLEDETGFLFVDYRQPLALFQWIFALSGVPQLIGQDVVARGWYRRGPVPYFELREIQWNGGSSVCYSREAQYLAAFATLLFCGAKGLGLF